MLRYIPSILRRSISEITRATPAPTSHPTPRGLTRVTQPGQALYAPEHIGGGRGRGRGGAGSVLPGRWETDAGTGKCFYDTIAPSLAQLPGVTKLYCGVCCYTSPPHTCAGLDSELQHNNIPTWVVAAGWENDAAAWKMFCSISEPATGGAWGRESCSDTCGVRDSKLGL